MWRWAIARAVLAWADGAVSSVFSVLPGWKLSWESSQLSSDSKASTDIYVKNYLVVVLIQTWQTKHWGPLSSLFRKNLICPLSKNILKFIMAEYLNWIFSGFWKALRKFKKKDIKKICVSSEPVYFRGGFTVIFSEILAKKFKRCPS